MSTHPVTFPWLLVPVSSSLLHHISVLTVKIQKKKKKKHNRTLRTGVFHLGHLIKAAKTFINKIISKPKEFHLPLKFV